MNRTFIPGAARRFREDPHVLLKRGDEVRHDLQWHDDLGAHRRLDRVVGLGGLDVALGERQDLAEREREVERRVRDGAEIRVGARKIGRASCRERVSECV